MQTTGSNGGNAGPARRFKRELTQLAFLIVVAIVAFAATQAVARSNRNIALSDARQWYNAGLHEQQTGDTAVAVTALRRALAKDRDNRDYAMALGRALERSGDADAAASVFLQLRESSPEDPTINLALARLAAGRGAVPDALRYYRSALYAPSSAADPALRRRIRLELIEFLLAHGDASRALSELLVAESDSPGDVASALQFGHLFARAGDAQRAKAQYLAAIGQDPRNVDGLIGAGTESFQLGQYADAARYLRASGSRSPAVTSLRDTANLVVTSDPLLDRLSTRERERRLAADLRAAADRLKECSGASSASGGINDVAKRIDDLSTRLRRRAVRDSDVFGQGVDLIADAERTAGRLCGSAPSAIDRALLLIARMHTKTANP